MSRVFLFLCLYAFALGGIIPDEVAAQSVAVVVSPSDSALNQFYAQRVSNPQAATRLIEAAAVRMPGNLRIQLEAGYHLIKLGRRDAALERFRAAALIEPDNPTVQRQLGFLAIEAGRDKEALAAFRRAHAVAPDSQTALQIAYLEQKTGGNRAATRSFKALLAAPEPAVRATACRAFGNLRGSTDRLLPTPWFGEFYAAPEYARHTRAGVAPLEMRVGVEGGDGPVVAAYGSVRGTRDSKSGKTVDGPQIYYDNVAVLAGGLRVKPWIDAPIFAFAEAGFAADLVNRNRDTWRGDTRIGAVFYREWNMAPPCGPDAPFGPRWIADAYADAVWFSRYRGNLIAFGRVRPGYRLYETADWAVDGYAILSGGTDTQNVKDNRYVEGGVGLALRLFDPIPLTIRAETLAVKRQDTKQFTDNRIRVEFGVRF